MCAKICCILIIDNTISLKCANPPNMVGLMGGFDGDVNMAKRERKINKV
jgi:hypothetical protein